MGTNFKTVLFDIKETARIFHEPTDEFLDELTDRPPSESEIRLAMRLQKKKSEAELLELEPGECVVHLDGPLPIHGLFFGPRWEKKHGKVGYDRRKAAWIVNRHESRAMPFNEICDAWKSGQMTILRVRPICRIFKRVARLNEFGPKTIFSAVPDAIKRKPVWETWISSQKPIRELVDLISYVADTYKDTGSELDEMHSQTAAATSISVKAWESTGWNITRNNSAPYDLLDGLEIKPTKELDEMIAAEDSNQEGCGIAFFNEKKTEEVVKKIMDMEKPIAGTCEEDKFFEHLKYFHDEYMRLKRKHSSVCLLSYTA